MEARREEERLREYKDIECEADDGFELSGEAI
jgi:hypothetical protein